MLRMEFDIQSILLLPLLLGIHFRAQLLEDLYFRLLLAIESKYRT